MKDDEVIEVFLEENAREIRRTETRQKVVRGIKVVAPIVALAGVVVLISIKISACMNASRLADEAKAIEEARVAAEHEKAEARIEADKAHIVVKYGPDGQATDCWVLKDKNSIAMNGGWGTSEIYMSHWKDYPWFAKQLRIDPNKCQVWDWPGKE